MLLLWLIFFFRRGCQGLWWGSGLPDPNHDADFGFGCTWATENQSQKFNCLRLNIWILKNTEDGSWRSLFNCLWTQSSCTRLSERFNLNSAISVPWVERTIKRRQYSRCNSSSYLRILELSSFISWQIWFDKVIPNFIWLSWKIHRTDAKGTWKLYFCTEYCVCRAIFKLLRWY